MIPHKWKRTAADNGFADPNADVRPDRPANTILGAIRGLMASGAASRDDAIGELVATYSTGNLYSVTSNEGLIDPATGINNVSRAITSPFLLRLSFDTTLSGASGNTAAVPGIVPHLVVDNFDCGPIQRRDGSALADGDLVKGRIVLVLGDMAAPTDTKVTRVRVLDQTAGELSSLIASLFPAPPTPVGVPTGGMLLHLGTDLPTGFLLANGGLYSRTTYAALWAWAQANTKVQPDSSWGSYPGGFSSGDGSTTFRVPDLRGVFFRGLDNGRGLDSGRVLGTFQSHAFQDHYHGLNAPNAGVLGAGGGGYNYANGGAGAGALSQYTTTSAYGANVAGETRPSNVAVVALIKY